MVGQPKETHKTWDLKSNIKPKYINLPTFNPQFHLSIKIIHASIFIFIEHGTLKSDHIRKIK